MNIDDYFAALERGWRHAKRVHIGRLEEPITCLTSDDYDGLVRCRVVFWDNSYSTSTKLSAQNWAIRSV